MDSKGLSAPKAREATRVPEEIRVPRDKLGPGAQQAPAVTAVTPATQEERDPMALLALVVQRVQEAIRAQLDSRVPRVLQDLAVPLAPQATWVQQAPQVLQEEWAP